MGAKKHNFLMLLMAGVFTLSTTLISCKAPNTPDKAAVAASNGIKTKVLRIGYQKFITKKINVKDVALSPEEYAVLTPPEIKP